MPILARWRPVANLPAPRGRDAMPGVYELADAEKNLVYIGQSARDVPNRIRQHLAHEGCIRERVCYWRYQYSRVPQAEEANLLARYAEANDGAAPPCNRAKPLERDSARRFSELFGYTQD